MNETVQARHRVALAGQVIDAITEKVIASAIISLTKTPPAFKRRLGLYATQFGASWKVMAERPDRTRSRVDGLFYFLDLPNGDYELNISAPSFGKRYGSVGQKVKVARDANGTYQLTWAIVSLPPTTIEGCISSKKTNISFAQVRVQGSGESAYSDDAGRYTITGVEPGKRTVLASAQGYKPVTQPVTIAKPGDVQTVNFNLLHSAG
jgi:hypothetical protein